MRTTIDLPDDLFREAKTRAIQKGTTLKNLVIQYIQSGLRGSPKGTPRERTRRAAPPVAIQRNPAGALVPARTNRELHLILQEEEIRSAFSDHPASTHGS